MTTVPWAVFIGEEARDGNGDGETSVAMKLDRARGVVLRVNGDFLSRSGGGRRKGRASRFSVRAEMGRMSGVRPRISRIQRIGFDEMSDAFTGPA
jgi:hypothetical protein